MAADTLEDSTFGVAAAEGRRLGTADVAEVYEANFQFVWRCLRSLGVRDHVLDDALQDVFVVVHDKLHHFDGRANLRTWLYSIALRVARRHRARIAKDAKKFVAHETDVASADEASRTSAELPATWGDLEHDVDAADRLKLARRALELLDDDKREAFVLACIEQMSAPEIVEITGLPLNTVYSRIRAARLAFAAQVACLQQLSRRSSR
jgi:RNA polymerase sigma-70 factor, ECF subfamily